MSKSLRWSESTGEWIGVIFDNDIKHSQAFNKEMLDASSFRLGPEKEAQPHNDWVRKEATPDEQRTYVVVTPRTPARKPEHVGSVPSLKWRKKYLARKKAAK